MMLFRVVLLAGALSIALSMLAYLLTRNRRYKQWAWNVTRGMLIALIVVLTVFAIERSIA